MPPSFWESPSNAFNTESESKKILPHPKQPEALEQSEPADEAALDSRGLAINVEADESLDILTGVSTSFTGTIADDCSPSFEWITVSNARRASITESDHRKRCKTVLITQNGPNIMPAALEPKQLRRRVWL